jgi:ATP-dependent HslUV protease subunit HslV
MSTMVVVRKNNVAVIASDTLTHCGTLKVSSKYKRNYHKIHRAGGGFVGLIGSAAHHLAFRSIARRYGADLKLGGADEIFETLLFVHLKLREEYFLNVNENGDQEYESSQMSGLIANPRGIFEFQSRREVVEHNRFWAIGSGQDFALGAMYDCYGRTADPRSVARTGLGAAVEFDEASAGPFIVHRVRLEGAGGTQRRNAGHAAFPAVRS